ncbi:DUF4105 domain-containing protein [Gaoshiqia sediminis]|uniref:DUF4105 domain-containing protein n=1 Tax=Gaoshiqia sediminis TaxID=2986998 RepID=A0AA41Y322_9BACT|nr:DUF4105 domain-containing protein [Gaoshiqia sediminis]MCW0482541.1 DUF4105 domain-containing protein [Gaoshiqia sediminis]
MRPILYPILIIFLLFLPFSGKAVQLSENAEISIMTCGPSELIHAIYGHTAIRVKDPGINLDVIFNYGVFSFSAPNFVYRFAKGQTDYMVAAERFSDFLEDYKRNGRSINEQVLNLTADGKQQLLDFLIDNARPENREYRYNFFFDNCASRVRDVVEKEAGATVFFQQNSGLEKTFRQHVTHYQEVLPWTNFGIQLVLGSPSDKVATAYQEMFLPYFLEKHFATAQMEVNGQKRPLVKATHRIYDAGEPESQGLRWWSPEVVLSVLLLLIIWFSVSQLRRKRVNYLVDYFLLFLTGLIGLGLLWFVWYSEHPAMRPNYNLMWAIPANFLFLFLWIIKKWRSQLKWYWLVLFIWMALFLLLSPFVPQAFPLGFYLIALMVLCRSLLHSFRFFWLKNKF